MIGAGKGLFEQTFKSIFTQQVMLIERKNKDQ